MGKGRRIRSMQTNLVVAESKQWPVLFPIRHLATGFMAEEQQWMYWKLKASPSESLRILTSYPWKDPREGRPHKSNSWDHPEQVLYTFNPKLYNKLCLGLDRWNAELSIRPYGTLDEEIQWIERMEKNGHPWENMLNEARRIPATNNSAASLYDILMFEDDVKYDWIHDICYPWGYVETKETGEMGDGKHYDRPVTKSERWSILERDDFRCCICGNTGSLEVDHVMPFAKGGSSVPWNLWTLCHTCNNGKRDKVS